MTQKRKNRAKPKDEFAYPGELGELPPIGFALTDPEEPPLWFARGLIDLDGAEIKQTWKSLVEDDRARFADWQKRCMRLLCDYYEITCSSSSNWQLELAMALAAEHVPAFQVQRAVRQHQERRAKKPTKLDVVGTACLYLRNYLKDVSKRRALTTSEKRLVDETAREVKKRRLAGSTERRLSNEMLGAHAAYWRGSATDFQRQFVEQVDPLITKWISGEAHLTQRPAP